MDINIGTLAYVSEEMARKKGVKEKKTKKKENK